MPRLTVVIDATRRGRPELDLALMDEPPHPLRRGLATRGNAAGARVVQQLTPVVVA